MSNRLDLDEQEQLDSLRHFWQKYGAWISGAVLALLCAYVATNGWGWYQRDRAAKASVLYDEIERAVKAGDVERAARVFADMRQRYDGTVFTDQAGLLAAQVQWTKGQGDAALASLTWVANSASDADLRLIARLRMAGALLDQKKPDQALQQLPSDPPAAFAALVADRRGDVLMAQGKLADAQKAYAQAYAALDETVDYRRLVQAKLTALGAPPAAASAPSSPASGSTP